MRLRGAAIRAGLLVGLPAGLAAHTAVLAATDDPDDRAALLGPTNPPALRDVAAIRSDIHAVLAGDGARGRWLAGELSSDHAGETGAVYIYRGALQALQVRALS